MNNKVITAELIESVESYVESILDDIVDGNDPDSMMSSLDLILDAVGSKKDCEELIPC
jgi:hypothetical protein